MSPYKIICIDVNYDATVQELVAGLFIDSVSISTALLCHTQIQRALRNLNGLNSVRLKRVVRLRPYNINPSRKSTSVDDCMETLLSKARSYRLGCEAISAIELFALSAKLKSIKDEAEGNDFSDLTGSIIGYRPIKQSLIKCNTYSTDPSVFVLTYEYPVLIVKDGMPVRMTTVHGAGPIGLVSEKTVYGATSYGLHVKWVHRDDQGGEIAKGLMHG